MSHIRKKTQWTVIANPGANLASNAVKAAQPRHRHYITGFSLSSNGGTPAAVMATVESGTTEKDRIALPAAVWAPILMNYVHPIECGINETAEVNLPALGAGVAGVAVVRGFTIAE